MTTNAAAPDPTRTPQRDFFELNQRIKDAGLLDRRLGWYAGRAAALVLGFVAAFVLLVVVGQSWWQLAVAVLFAVLFTQTAFLGHDAAHQQVFASGRHNQWTSRIVGNLVVGLSHGWWARKHSRHHATPNTLGKDGDVATGAIVFDPRDVPARTGVVGWVTRHQGWLFFPMLMLEGLALHRTAVQTVARDPQMRHRRVEAALLAVRLLGFPAVVIWLLGPGLGAAFLAVQLVAFGVYLGASFAPNHKGMPLLGERDTVDFLRRQVLTSRNVKGGRSMSWAMGGLNYQIEHHVFPRMPSVSLRRAQPIVRDFCAEHGIVYTETGLLASYRIVVRYLNRVGMGQADPFDCPIVAQHRPR